MDQEKHDQAPEVPGVKNILKFMTSSKAQSLGQERFTQANARLGQTTANLVDQIFLKFSWLYKTKFWKDFEVIDPDPVSRKEKIRKKLDACKSEWVDSDLKFFSEEEIGKALDRAKHEFGWPPTLPEFISLCEYCSEYDNAEKAYNNACQKPVKELDLVTRIAVQEFGQFELKTMRAEKTKADFIRKYREVILRKRRGEDLSKQIKTEPKALECLPLPKDENRRRLQAAREKSLRGSSHDAASPQECET